MKIMESGCHCQEMILQSNTVSAFEEAAAAASPTGSARQTADCWRCRKALQSLSWIMRV